MIKPMRSIRRTIILYFLCIAPQPLFSAAGETTAEFLLLGAGARAAGMGGAVVSAVKDVNATYWNPAALMRIDSMEISLMRKRLLAGITYDHVAVAYPFKKVSFGASVNHLFMDNIEGRGPNGQVIDSFSARDTAAAVSMGLRLTERFSAGLSTTFIQQKLAGTSASTFSGDIGFLFERLRGDYDLGFSLKHMGKGQNFINDDYPLPWIARLGLSRRMFNNRMVMSFDASKVKGSDIAKALGTEFFIMRNICLRAGYKDDAELDSSVGLSGGFGFALANFGIDYAFVPFDDLGDTHHFSVIYRFGLNKTPTFPKKQEVSKPRKKRTAKKQVSQEDLRKSLEKDLAYYEKQIVPVGTRGRIQFLEEVIKKYESQGLDSMYLIHVTSRMDDLYGVKRNAIGTSPDKLKKKR